MILDKLSIINYRNISETTLTLSPNINCFIGLNGVGKTNLLDAVYYLSFCHSSYSVVDSQLIRHSEDYMMLEGLYHDEQGSTEQITCGLKRGQKKIFKRNDKAYKLLSQHIGLIPVVMVSPTDQSLILGGSEERRRFMDMVISQHDPIYIDILNRNNKALQQRNALLKQEDEPDQSLMEVLEMEMAMTGEQLFRKRADFIDEFVGVFQKIYKHISGGNETVGLDYVSHCQRGNLIDVIQRDRFKDRAIGYSLHGVHKDDIEMKLDDYLIKREGSQGQNKTYVLAMKLAQYEYLCSHVSRTTPLLLLDDIFDKLDSERVERIVDLVAGENYGQIFITDTNRDHLDKILSASRFGYCLFSVRDGRFSKIDGHAE